MPIYEYFCQHCGKNYDVSKPMCRAEMVELCPDCGIRLERVYKPLSFSFGWRLTDRCHERFGPKEEFEKDV